MKLSKYTYLLIFSLINTVAVCVAFTCIDNDYVTYIVNPKIQPVKFYYKNKHQQRYGSIQNLKNQLEKSGKKLVFAMNGGMYKKVGAPQGLYVENGKTLSDIDTTDNAYGNFYLQPNGIFYIDIKNNAGIVTTKNFKDNGNIRYATQSGPMLLTDGKIHNAFKEGSSNLQIRNGVGILPNNKVVFAMSRERVNFYDFALYFKKMGCTNALYLDGFVSRTYLPEQNCTQIDGDFGVIIAVTK